MERATARRIYLGGVCLAVLLLVAYAFGVGRSFSYALVPTDIRGEQGRWSERIRAVGGKNAYEELGYAVRVLTPTQQHVPAHIFGGALYEEEGLPGLNVCDTRFLYGCFHEFLSRAILEGGLSVVPTLEKKCKSLPKSGAPLGCEHGLGHGLLSYFGYEPADLKEAVSACDMLEADPWHACAQGAFMEYNFRFLTLGEGTGGRPVPEDVYDPCYDYEGEIGQRCVGIIPLWWRAILFPDEPTTAVFSWLGDKCQNLPQELQHYKAGCFRSIGFVAATTQDADASLIEQSCRAASAGKDNFLQCMFYASVGVQNKSDIETGLSVCKRLSAEDQPACEYYVSSVPLI